MNTRLCWGLATAAALAASGCVTLYQPETATDPDPIEEVRHRLSRIEDRLAGLEMGQTQLQSELAALQRSAPDNTATRAQLLDFEKRLQAVDAAREADKKYIIETISQKVAGIVNTRAASPPSAPSRRTSEYGYEHVVKAGETLSEIAAAYKTTTDAIVKANGLKDANSIRAGQKLFIPE